VSYDETLAARIRDALGKRTDVVEKKMFGGLCFMVGGAMCCGLTKTDFMVRVGPDQYDDALAQPHARPMDFTGRPSATIVYVAREGLRSRAALAKWVGRGVSFVSSLRPKAARKRKTGSDGNASAKSKGAAERVQSSAEDPRVARLLRALRSDPELARVVDTFEKAEPGPRKFVTPRRPPFFAARVDVQTAAEIRRPKIGWARAGRAKGRLILRARRSYRLFRRRIRRDSDRRPLLDRLLCRTIGR